MYPFRNGAAGVVSSAKLFRSEHFAGLTTITASRYRARASRPSAALRWLRNFHWCRSLPLLCEEGNSARFYVSQFFHRPYDRRYSRLWLKLALMGASRGSISVTRQAAKRRQSFEFCRPCGAGMYMHTDTQRLRAGLCSHAASRLGQPSDFKIC